MKRGTPRHPKIMRLCEELGVDHPTGVGILELLWHFTADYAPAGDIGRHSNKTIANAVHWKKKPDALIGGLVISGWVDTNDDDARLVVHDWVAHCDDAVHMKLARARKFFWDGTAPKTGRLPKAEREPAERFFSAPRADVSAHSVRTENPQKTTLRGGEGCFSISSTEKNSSTETRAQGFDCRTLAETLWEIHPSPADFAGVERNLSLEKYKAVHPETFDERITASLRAWAAYWKSENRFATGLAKWIESGDYARKPPKRQSEAQQPAVESADQVIARIRGEQ